MKNSLKWATHLSGPPPSRAKRGIFFCNYKLIVLIYGSTLDGSRDEEIKFQGYDGPIKIDSGSDSISEEDPRLKSSDSSSASNSDSTSTSNDSGDDSDDFG